jgi:long-subunit fatty acid transport protein
MIQVNYYRVFEIIILCIFLHFCCPGSGLATVHEQLAVSTKAMSLGNAVTAYPPGIMSIHYNPAGLTRLEDREFTFGCMYPVSLKVTSKFYNDPDFEGFMGFHDDPVAGRRGTSDKGLMYLPGLGTKHVLLAPNIGISHRESGSRWTLGFGIYAPYGGGFYHSDKNDPAWFGGFAYNQRLVYAGPAIACKVTDTFSVGFSVGLGQSGEGIRMDMRTPNDIVALTDILGEVTKGLEIPVVSELTLPSPWFGGGLPTYGRLASFDFDVRDDFDTSFNVGFLWEPVEWFSFGACYQSEAKSKPSGRYSFKYSKDWQNFVNWFGMSPLTLTVAGIFDLPYQPVSQQTGKVVKKKFYEPQRAQCGIMLRPLKRLRVMCDLHWVDWSVHKKDVFKFDQDIQLFRVTKLLGYSGGDDTLVLERHWKDTWHVSFGTEYQLFNWLCLRAGYEPRKSSIPDKYYDLTWPIHDWKMYTCGAGIKLASNMDIDFAFAYLTGKEYKLPNNTSQILNSTDFTKIVYNPYAGLDYKQKTEGYLISINFNYKW